MIEDDDMESIGGPGEYHAVPDDDADNGWAIMDPDGDYICTVDGKGSAESLLSHLNRG